MYAKSNSNCPVLLGHVTNKFFERSQYTYIGLNA